MEILVIEGINYFRGSGPLIFLKDVNADVTDIKAKKELDDRLNFINTIKAHHIRANQNQTILATFANFIRTSGGG